MASNCVDVYIKLPTGKTTMFNVRTTDSVHTLCELVATQEKVQSQQIVLQYQGKQLEKSKTVQDYGIRIETILIAKILIAHDVCLAILVNDGRKDEIVVSSLDTVAMLYKKIADNLAVSVDYIQLQLDDRVFASSKFSVDSSGLTNGCTINVTIRDSKISQESEKMEESMKQMILSSFESRGKNVEVVFSFDTTGSMYCYLATIREKLRASCSRLLQDIPNIRIGIIAHGDYCDSQSSYAIRYTDLTSNISDLVQLAMNVPATSGGDSPECYELVLKKAQLLDWSENSAKALVIIGDNHPHQPSYTDQNLHWRSDLNVLVGMGIKMYGVQAGSCSESSNFYKEISEVSGGCYLQLEHIDVITDMFLAVCYEETDQRLLDNFEHELAANGDVTQKSQALISQLKQERITRNNESRQLSSRRYVAQPWWDVSLDSGQPQYEYNINTDKWTSVNRYSAVSPIVLIDHPVTLSVNTGNRKKKRRCSIM